jgi:hypothetical protein
MMAGERAISMQVRAHFIGHLSWRPLSFAGICKGPQFWGFQFNLHFRRLAAAHLAVLILADRFFSRGATKRPYVTARTFVNLLADQSGRFPMYHKGIEYSLTMIEPGFWGWQFKIGDSLKSGRTRASELLAIRRVQMRIDRELRKYRTPDPVVLRGISATES